MDPPQGAKLPSCSHSAEKPTKEDSLATTLVGGIKKDPIFQEIAKGNSAIHKFAANGDLVGKLPCWKVKKMMVNKPPVVISGPYNKEVFFNRPDS